MENLTLNCILQNNPPPSAGELQWPRSEGGAAEPLQQLHGGLRARRQQHPLRRRLRARDPLRRGRQLVPLSNTGFNIRSGTTGCPKVRVTTLIPHNFYIVQYNIKSFESCNHDTMRFFLVSNTLW